LQKKFQKAVQISGISKPANLTILKNSFAVHLIEKGVDIRYIQQMLGHKHSKTTMKYLRVSKRDLSAIQSPLDSLDV
ncbi:MAG: tyrosine-type recombinase/integrase, partial [Candidatus Cloacimonetes bacterium]|nr:tyrosine-type recombinase/integrase [Candidatus Cloacimonadota bacterium]